MPWILDGNNLAGGGDRSAVRAAALAVARAERVRLLVFFDGAPPPGGREVERLGSVEVRYVADADAAILDLLAGRGRGFRLATDDRALAGRARAAGAEVVAGAAFWRKADAAVGRGEAAPEGDRQPLDGAQVFREATRLPSAPARIARRASRRHR